MAWVQSSPKGGIRQGYSTHYGISTKFHRSPLPGGSDGSAVRGAATERKRGSGLRPLPHFSFRRSTSRGPSGPLEHPPKRVRQGKPSGSRRPAGSRRGPVRPLWGLDFIFPAEGRQPRKM